MQVSVIGLAGSGKTTLMEAMSGLSTASGSSKSGIATVRVPDERIDKLSEIFKPKKTTYAEFRLQEIPWTAKDSSNRKSEAERYVKSLGGAEMLIHVIRSFENPYLKDSPDAARDLAAMDEEMLLADLVSCEGFFDRQKKRPAEPNVKAAMEKAKACLENEQFLYTSDFSDEEKKLIAGFGFATMIPQLVVVNLPEGETTTDLTDEFRTVLAVPLQLAREVSELPADEQADFFDEMGLAEPFINHIAKETYGMMKLISFFTVGEDEVRAWTIRENTTAQKAAGKIHSDLERGFIRAEIVSYETFIEKGTMKACKDSGTLRIEGKNYLVQDGEICHVRFNV